MDGKNNIFPMYYRVIETLYDNQVTINDNTFTPMTQSDIAVAVGCDRMTVNSIIKKLKSDNMLNTEHIRKNQYKLSDEAIRIVKAIKKI